VARLTSKEDRSFKIRNLRPSPVKREKRRGGRERKEGAKIFLSEAISTSPLPQFPLSHSLHGRRRRERKREKRGGGGGSDFGTKGLSVPSSTLNTTCGVRCEGEREEKGGERKGNAKRVGISCFCLCVLSAARREWGGEKRGERLPPSPRSRRRRNLSGLKNCALEQTDVDRPLVVLFPAPPGERREKGEKGEKGPHIKPFFSFSLSLFCWSPPQKEREEKGGSVRFLSLSFSPSLPSRAVQARRKTEEEKKKRGEEGGGTPPRPSYRSLSP